jgi:hypothetical protein
MSSRSEVAAHEYFDHALGRAIASLKTRSDVRGFLAKEIETLIAGHAQGHLPTEFEQLSTSSDREVVQTSLRLDRFFGLRSAAEAKSADDALGRRVRDLFTTALRRMKELPPDPRETLHAKPLAAPTVTRPAHRRRK